MIDWTPLLLSDTSANLRYLVLTELLQKDEKDPEILQIKQIRARDPILKPILEKQNENGSWNPGIIYNSDHRSQFQVTCDVLKRLGYLGYNAQSKIVVNASEYLFKYQNEDGSWPNSSKNIDGITPIELDFLPLHTALPLHALVTCGYAEDKRALKAFNWLLDKQLSDGAWPTGKAGGGVNMYRAGYRKLPLSKFGCRSNTTAVLNCLAYHPKLKHSDEAKRAIEHLLTCQTEDRQSLGFEVSRITGFEGTSGTLTYYAKLDHLLTLDLSWRLDVSKDDMKLSKIIDFVKGAVNKYGLLTYIPNILATRWITFDLIRSLRNLKINEKWSSDDLNIPFQKYIKINKRY